MFDLNADVTKPIKDDSIAFAIDQTAVPAGLPADRVPELYKTNANTVGGGQPVLTARASWTRATSTRSRSWRAKDAMSTVGRPPNLAPVADERLANIGLTARVLRLAESARCSAAIVVAIFFWTQSSLFLQLDGIANWTDVASTIGIPAVMVALLMIGGEFDLSAGVMTGTAGLTMGILATEVGMNIWLAIVLTLAMATGIGFLNGYMVMKTKLPSFIVTLATFFILQGANLGVTKVITTR